MSDNYDDALRAAGATVHAFKTFGCYQGIWLAKVDHNGRIGWVKGYYGSCSDCDALEDIRLYSWDEEDAEKAADYLRRLREIGESDLARIWSYDELVADFGPEPCEEDAKAVEWMKTVEEP